MSEEVVDGICFVRKVVIAGSVGVSVMELVCQDQLALLAEVSSNQSQGT